VTDAITVWRLTARRFARAALSGQGAFRYGGRWNLPGTRIIYCAESRALATLEALVHVEDIEDLGAVEWQATAITLPSSAIERPLRYPRSWRIYPYVSATQRFGSKWARSQASVALRVPSAVVSGEFNYLLNPLHPDFSGLIMERPEPFRFDPRLAH
jgi:RES domain-containing protein